MKKILFILLIHWYFSASIISQCLDLGIEFTTQTGIDQFKTNYPGCTQIAGPITISGDEITNLIGLSEVTHLGQINIENTSNLLTLEGLESLKEALIIAIYNNPGLQSLDGLDSLELVDFLLVIQENENLVNLSGLNSLKEAFGLFVNLNPALQNLNGLDELVYVHNLAIDGNPLLTNLSGMPKLDSIVDLYVANNTNLLNLTGLENINSFQNNVILFRNPSLNSLTAFSDLNLVGKNLEISENSSLASFNGLNSLVHIGGEFIVKNNPLLQSFQGLNSLQYIGSNTNIRYNDALENFYGLESVHVMKEDIYITDNVALTSLSGLDNIEYPYINSITLNHNPSLSYCAIASVCNFLANEENSQFIIDNNTGCNTAEEVRNSCLVPVHNLNETSIQLFPNPTSGKFEIIGDGLDETIINVTDSKGRNVKDFIYHKSSMDLSNLPNGIYFISFLSKDSRIVKRVVKGM